MASGAELVTKQVGEEEGSRANTRLKRADGKVEGEGNRPAAHRVVASPPRPLRVLNRRIQTSTNCAKCGLRQHLPVAMKVDS